MSLPVIFPTVVVAGGTPSVVFTDSNIQTGLATTTVTFTGASLGAARSDRRIAVLISHSSSNVLSTVTIGGVSASQVVQTNNSTVRATIWIATVPSGTTGNIVITCASNLAAVVMGVHAIYGLRSSTATATATDAIGPTDLSIAVEARGIVLACNAASNAAGPGTTTWTGVSETYENVSGTWGGSGGSYTATGATTLAVSGSGYSGFLCGCGASFR